MEREHAALVAAAIVYHADGKRPEGEDPEEAGRKVVAIQQAIMRVWAETSPPMMRGGSGY